MTVPAHVKTQWGFWSDTNGPRGNFAQVGAGHTFVHFGPDGYVDRFANPPSSTGLPATTWASFDPWSYGTADQPQPLEPSQTGTSPALPPGAPPLPPADQPLPPGTPPTPPAPVPDTGFEPCPPGYYRALVGPDAGKCLPIEGSQTPGTPGATPSKTIVLHGHFEVGAQFNTGVQSGDATPVKITDDAAWFWFFSDNNPEILVKVVGDAEKPWVFIAGLTDVGCTVTVTDTKDRSRKRQYVNRQGVAYQPVQDTSAFA